MEQNDSGGGSYDGSASGSNSATVSSRAGAGLFSVGGGVKIPSIGWAALLAFGALLMFGWLKKRKR